MNRKQAEAQGLRFTGIYSQDKEYVKGRIANERIERLKARIILVTIPDSKYSRGGGGTGYSAYADKVYFAYDTVVKCHNILNAHKSCIAAITLDYGNAIKAQNEKHDEALDSLDQARIIIGDYV